MKDLPRLPAGASAKAGAQSKGFTLIEVLVTAFVLATVVVGITGLAMVSTRIAIESERQNVAQAIANEEVEITRTYRYPEVDYTDFHPGKIERKKTVTRNDQEYLVEAFITYVDDPANGTLPEGSGLSKETADFTKVLFKVSWKSNISSSDSPTSSSTVVAATLFSDQTKDWCEPGTVTCENPQLDCVPGTPAGCADETGELTLDCPASGICPGSGTEPFVDCPASGKCADVPLPDDGNSPTPTPSSDSGGGDGDNGGQCLNPVISNPAAVLEVCDASACNDGLDNDNDGNADEADEQCQAMARDGGLFVPDGPCIRKAAWNPEDCSGEQRFREIAPVTGLCEVGQHCGTKRLWWRACQVAGCEQTPTACQRKFGCPELSSCAGCPPDRVKCSGGRCWECLAKPDPVTGELGNSECERLKGPNPNLGAWICRNGKCAECKSVNVDDPLCRRRNPYCVGGRCVACRNDNDCVTVVGNPKKYCRLAAYPVGDKNTCQDECHNGRDDDGDGRIDATGLDRNGDGTPEIGPDADCVTGDSEFPECSNGFDDDHDGQADFPNDPGCLSPDDPSEFDQVVTQCSDRLDNDGDGQADFPNDPGCLNPQDNDETDIVAPPANPPPPAGGPRQ